MLRPYRGVLPRVHPTAFVDDSAQLIGDVEIGEESSVWMTVVIREEMKVPPRSLVMGSPGKVKRPT